MVFFRSPEMQGPTAAARGREVNAASRAAPTRSVQAGTWGLIKRWMICNLRHQHAHHWFPRYLDGYGTCSVCGRQWS
jgi:hypothetical protein